MIEDMLAFATKYKISPDDPDLKELYDCEMSALRDRASALEEAWNDGYGKGLREGREAAYQTKMVRRMLANGAPVELIYKISCLSRQEIDAILNEQE